MTPSPQAIEAQKSSFCTRARSPNAPPACPGDAYSFTIIGEIMASRRTPALPLTAAATRTVKMVRVGSFASFWRSASHLRSTPIGGHSQGGSARLKPAIGGHQRLMRSRKTAPLFDHLAGGWRGRWEDRNDGAAVRLLQSKQHTQKILHICCRLSARFCIIAKGPLRHCCVYRKPYPS